jgi:pimeloyl-ACP methyl ester carboxylesterase
LPKAKDRPLVWYIHGANSSPVSFRYVRPRLADHEHHEVRYYCNTPVRKIIDSLVEEAEGETRPINIVSHSLGGVIAVSISQRVPIRKIVTMGTPFGGSRVATFLRWITPSQLFDDIHPGSGPMTDLRRKPLTCPVMSLVSTAGNNPFLTEDNDGVVTVASQLALDGPTYIQIPTNHFEMLLHDEATSLINGFLFDR